MVENHLVGVLSYFRKLLERMGLACRKGSGPPSSSKPLLPFTFIVVDFLVVALLSAIRFRVISLLV